MDRCRCPSNYPFSSLCRGLSLCCRWEHCLIGEIGTYHHMSWSSRVAACCWCGQQIHMHVWFFQQQWHERGKHAKFLAKKNGMGYKKFQTLLFQHRHDYFILKFNTAHLSLCLEWSVACKNWFYSFTCFDFLHLLLSCHLRSCRWGRPFRTKLRMMQMMKTMLEEKARPGKERSPLLSGLKVLQWKVEKL